MPTKRELDEETKLEDQDSAADTPSTPKKAKSSNTKTTPKKSPSTPSATGSARPWDNTSKSALVKRLVETGIKNMDWKALADETGMSEAACKNQLTPGRANVRKVVTGIFE